MTWTRPSRASESTPRSSKTLSRSTSADTPAVCASRRATSSAVKGVADTGLLSSGGTPAGLRRARDGRPSEHDGRGDPPAAARQQQHMAQFGGVCVFGVLVVVVGAGWLVWCWGVFCVV